MTMTQAVSDERLREIVQKIVDDAELRVVTMKPTYDAVDLGVALLRPLLALRSATPEPVAWQRRLWNTQNATDWGPWKECTVHQAEFAQKFGRVEDYPEYLKAEARPLHAAPTSTEAGREISGALRVCPERDALCPHGMSCPYSHGYRCDMEGSRAAINKGGE